MHFIYDASLFQYQSIDIDRLAFTGFDRIRLNLKESRSVRIIITIPGEWLEVMPTDAKNYLYDNM